VFSCFDKNRYSQLYVVTFVLSALVVMLKTAYLETQKLRVVRGEACNLSTALAEPAASQDNVPVNDGLICNCSIYLGCH
jgi:hypothetical protein